MVNGGTFSFSDFLCREINNKITTNYFSNGWSCGFLIIEFLLFQAENENDDVENHTDLYHFE